MTQKPAMMTNEQLAEAVARVKELDAKRTQGEWTACDYSNDWFVHNDSDDSGEAMATIASWPKDREANAAFIAHAPQMAAIITQQDAIIQQQREVMRLVWFKLQERSLDMGDTQSVPLDDYEEVIAAIDAALKGGE